MGASKQECIDYIQSLAESELAQFMNAALSSRTQDERSDGGRWSTMRYCLAHVTHGADLGMNLDDPSIVLVAVPMSFLPNAERTLLCEEGKCSNCRATIVCSEKGARCPVCDFGPVHCT
jgi:hypothetical protein